jgi:hypothetical protein
MAPSFLYTGTLSLCEVSLLRYLLTCDGTLSFRAQQPPFLVRKALWILLSAQGASFLVRDGILPCVRSALHSFSAHRRLLSHLRRMLLPCAMLLSSIWTHSFIRAHWHLRFHAERCLRCLSPFTCATLHSFHFSLCATALLYMCAAAPLISSSRVLVLSTLANTGALLPSCT